MTPLPAALLGFVLGMTVVWVMDAIDEAPEGWQDERTGEFHYGKRPDDAYDDEHPEEWAECENPPRPMCARCGHGYYQHDEHDAMCEVRPHWPTLANRCGCPGYEPRPHG
jgi:hypothetical protein